MIRSLTLACSVLLAWVTADGTLAFADDPKKVPAKYKGAVVERTWEELRKLTAKRWTVDYSRARTDN